MSKKSRARAKQKRAREKRSRKDQMKQQYQAWRDAGITKGSKRSKAKAAKQTFKKKSGNTKIPFPYHLWLDKQGKLSPGSPHKAYLAYVHR